MVTENQTETSNNPTTTTNTIKPFTLEILKLIKDAQQQHGLRHGDYQRYRGYCSRRLRRLRKVLKLPQGDRRHFKKRDVNDLHITNPKSDERYLHIPLILAERCWAYAMQLRQEANTEPKKKFHVVQKLRKACVYALQLEELCKQERCDARTKLESQAYVAWIHGSLQFELQLWLKAIENLKKCQLIYEKLSTTLPINEQLSYKQRIDEIIPSLRYCSYNIGDEKAVNLLELRNKLDNFDNLLLQANEKSKIELILHEINWFNMKITITIERVRLFLLSIKDLNDSLCNTNNNQEKIQIIENLLIDLRDCIQLIRDNIKNDKNDEKLQLLLTYLISIRVERTTQRNLLLIKQTKKIQDCIRLFDIIIQQTSELKQNDLIKNIELAQIYYNEQLDAYKVLRLYYLGNLQGIQRHWNTAAIFYNKSFKLYKQLTNFTNFTNELLELLDFIKDNAEIDTIISQANFIFDEEDIEQQINIPQKIYKHKKPLVERLDEFHEEPQLLTKNPNIVVLPPKMKAISCKPLFYDLALNSIELPDLQEKLLDGGLSKQKRAGAGISDFVKGLWGWGKK